ncbi:hypothetical protein [Allorhodopirellula solitaria]|uniref:hypothetical protein n=1 Tax=Allorhodopirellula solitaria TaxID=2527987 RepID=UPI0011B6089E|nr:hypothetical protein [Allorhodopirellula solitaria]
MKYSIRTLVILAITLSGMFAFASGSVPLLDGPMRSKTIASIFVGVGVLAIFPIGILLSAASFAYDQNSSGDVAWLGAFVAAIVAAIIFAIYMLVPVAV